MSEEKNIPSTSDVNENGTNSIAQSSTENNLSVAEKLKAAAGNIAKAKSYRSKGSGLAKKQERVAKETEARLAEAEKRRIESEKQSQRLRDEQQAAYEYADSYRKKLIKDMKKAQEAEKLRYREAREAKALQDREIRSRELAAHIEKERREAEERAKRATAVLNSITKREVVDEDGNKIFVDRFSQENPEEKNDSGSLNNKVPNLDNSQSEDGGTVEENENTESAGIVEETVDAEEEKFGEEILSEEQESSEEEIASEEQDNSEEETVSEESKSFADEAETADEEIDNLSDEETSEETVDEADDGKITVDFDDDATEDADEGDYIEIEPEVAEVQDEEDSFEMVFDEDGKLIVRHKSQNEESEETKDSVAPEDEIPEPDLQGAPERKKEHVTAKNKARRARGAEDDSEVADDEVRRFLGRHAGARVRRRLKNEVASSESDSANNITKYDLIWHDELIKTIESEGESLTDDALALKKYYSNSKEALLSFEKSFKVGKKALYENRDESESPGIIISLMKICGRILSIRCSNLEHYARVKAYKYVREARIALRRSIDEYNELAISYSALTGEQLTRLSTFLPENIASGKSRGVIPQIVYKESYVQVYPDADGKLPREDDSVLVAINPPLTADYLFGGYKEPKSKFGCSVYKLRAKGAVKKLRSCSDSMCRDLSGIRSAEKKYQAELNRLKSTTHSSDLNSREYKNKLFSLRIKYGRMLTGIDTIQTKSAFSRLRIRSIIGCLAVEREKLVIAYKLLRETYRHGTAKQKRFAESNFSGALISYNRCAESVSRATGIMLDSLPPTLLEQACRGVPEIIFPVVAYKRVLVETVGDETRVIGMNLKPLDTIDEQGYIDNAEKLTGKNRTVRDKTIFFEDSSSVDRASSIARILLASLKESAEGVVTTEELAVFLTKSERAIRYFKRALKNSEKAISRAFDENGVVTALVENLRVLSNIIEVRRINITLCVKLRQPERARGDSKALYREIERYNGRAIDYMSIVGEQFSRINAGAIKTSMHSAESLVIPKITYKDNYIEVFPKDPLQESVYEKPVQRRGGVYTPVLMHNFRLTENNAVETTVINSPFVFDVDIDEIPVESWWHPIGIWQHLTVLLQPIAAFFKRLGTNAELWFIDESLLFAKDGLKGRQDKTESKKRKYERKLARLNEERDARIMALETIVHETDRHSASYQQKLYKINSIYSRKIYKLRLKWTEDCPGRTGVRLMLERLVLERERISGLNKLLLKYRNYGRITFTKNILVRYKKRFLDAINDHNETAKIVSELTGTKFSEISTLVADEIIRYAKVIKFPQIVCCREVIENLGDTKRTIGDKWHGYGLYTGATGTPAGDSNAPIMSVGAMGYSTDMGVPYFKADFDGMTMLGMTPGGVPLIGFTNNGEASIPFTGTPMMLSGTDASPALDAGMEGQTNPLIGAVNSTRPYSGMNSRSVDANYVEEIEEDAKVGITTETSVDLETEMIDERFSRSLRARSMTTVDGAGTWWKLIGSEINIIIQRHLVLRHRGFLRFLLPDNDEFLENVNIQVNKEEEKLLTKIAKLGSIIDIECKRLYSAAKAGIRRSERKWSFWLYRDIEIYNGLVNEYNNGRPRNEMLDHLSLTIPDRIIHRLDDRPPSPPTLRFRNKVKEAPYGWSAPTSAVPGDTKKDKRDTWREPLAPNNLFEKVYVYVDNGVFRHAGFFRMIVAPFVWLNLHSLRFLMELFERASASLKDIADNSKNSFWLWRITLIPLMRITLLPITRLFARTSRTALLGTMSREVRRRSVRTYIRRQNNEDRHYRIRYEKARNMKRYNKQVLRAIGISDDPIKYQEKSHKVLRKYVARNFRIDYNMRIRQLLYRSLRVDCKLYWFVNAVLASTIIVLALLGREFAEKVMIVAFLWAILPLLLFITKIVCKIIIFIVNLVLLVSRNIWLVCYGAKDVERNRYGLVLDCFISEQYKLLIDCERLRYKNSARNRKRLIAEVNDYNRRRGPFSKALRISIKEVETTSLIDKLVSPLNLPLTEIQNFYYVRELLERMDEHEVGDTLPDREFADLRTKLNEMIVYVRRNADILDETAVDNFGNDISEIVRWVEEGIRPSENKRFEIKDRICDFIETLDFLTDTQKEEYSRSVIRLVDYQGGQLKRKIIRTVALDNMIY